jgi:hypothetical protein
LVADWRFYQRKKGHSGERGRKGSNAIPTKSANRAVGIKWGESLLIDSFNILLSPFGVDNKGCLFVFDNRVVFAVKISRGFMSLN